MDICLLAQKNDHSIAKAMLKELNLLGVTSQYLEVNKVFELRETIMKAYELAPCCTFMITKEVAQQLQRSGKKYGRLSSRFIPLCFSIGKNLEESIKSIFRDIVLSKSRSVEALAADLITEVGNPSRKIALVPGTTPAEIWKSPIYLFRPAGQSSSTEDILIDVTWSSKPTRPEVAPALKKVFRQVFDHMGKTGIRILDFGAGKLRHTVHLLQMDHYVTACDYDAIYQKPTSEISKFMAQAGKMKRFKPLLYPNKFISCNDKFDLALLINVLNIMPEPLERLFVLSKCHDRLIKNGFVLWFTQHGDQSQLRATSEPLTDGGCTSGRTRRTFYRDFSSEEIMRLMSLAGFDRVDLKLDSGNNQAWLFQKSKRPLINIDNLIEKKRRVRGRTTVVSKDGRDSVVADLLDSDKFTTFGDIMQENLQATSPGRADWHRYEELITHIINYIFQQEFRPAQIERQYEIDQGRKRIDIRANWSERSSMKSLIEDRDLKSSWVPIECKNYSEILGNTEFSQIVDRFNKRSRHFGMIFCRRLINKRKVLEHCFDRYYNHEYLIIVLDDSDLNTMLGAADNDDTDKISRIILDKMDEITDRSPR